MSRLELSRGNKGLWQRVEALWRSMLPRQARVTRTDGGTVWVRFVDEGSDAPESQFPSTVAGVAAGTMGWVSTLGGKKGLFVATGVPVETHFGRALGSPSGENTTLVISSFAQGKSMWSSTLAALISETASGRWNVKMTVSAVVYRSVATGGVYLFAGNADTNANALGRLSPQTHAYTLIRTIDFKDVSGITVLDARYGGQSTAGTTHVVSYDVDVTAVRVG